MVPSLADDARSLDVTSNFSSPVSATSSHAREFSTPIGLGISRCGLEPSFDTMGGFTSQLPYSVTPSIPTQIAPMDDFYSLPMKVSDFSEQTGFGIYNGFPETTQSMVRYYGSQAMRASSSYNSPIETASLHTTFPGQVPGYWIPAACSGPTTPPEVVPIQAGNMTGSYWSAQCVPELCPTINAPVSQMAGGFSMPDNSFNLRTVPVRDSEDFFSKDVSDSGLSIPESPKSKQGEKVAKRSSIASRKVAASPPKRKISSKKGYACRVCGFSFTRRSNCAEHEKKHDPNHRRSYPCEECHKTFGRMADLRRHTDNVRKFTGIL
ncbi:Zinc finger C2H2 [Penicillium malachiteum]|uniref:Zinc finger C2H2 n=1 Tax=Penicillium malachiteum TaxID=1324776 RepID=UPI0025472554|nr:Zinc finger C2H2 [Penicillium malachiteum]KAJ5714590.1 Zinc finger C2H2 [Penicillium malachiteum]